MSSFRSAFAAALVAGIAALGSTACAPQPDPPVPVMVAAYTNSGVFEPTPVELMTIRDVTALKGDAANFIGGSRIIIDPNDPLYGSAGPTSFESFRNIALKQKGGDVRGNFLAHDSVLWPADFHTWAMTTGYWNFELAHNYFVDTGLVDPAEIASPDVYYSPFYIDAFVFAGQQFDNALWDPRMSGFIIQPFRDLQGLPAIMNRGAMAHEFSHLVFTVRGGPELFEALVKWQQTSAVGSLLSGWKVLKSLDEGFADYHAVQSLCQDGGDPECGNTRFLAPTLGETYASQRDMAIDTKCLTADQANALGSGTLLSNGNESLWYYVGTAIAASLYQAAQPTGQHSTVVQALLQSYDDQNVDPTRVGLRQVLGIKLSAGANTFSLVDALTPLVSHLPNGELKDRICGNLIERLRINLTATAFDACPSPQYPEVCPG